MSKFRWDEIYYVNKTEPLWWESAGEGAVRSLREMAETN